MQKTHILLIHGTWCNGNNWGDFATELGQRGFIVHTPTLRHHGAPSESDSLANAAKVCKVGLLDYVSDLIALIDTMDSPPIVIGHSLGTLIAQLVAVRRPTQGLVLLGPAPAAGMFGMYPSMFLLWGRYVPQWLARKPMQPVSWQPWVQKVCNKQPYHLQKSYYDTLCAESGTVYFEMALWFLDRKKAAKVDFDAIKSPVLIITGSEDKCTVPQIGRAVAQKFGDQATYVELQGSDHMMTMGHYMPQTLATIDNWLADHCLCKETIRAKISL